MTETTNRYVWILLIALSAIFLLVLIWKYFLSPTIQKRKQAALKKSSSDNMSVSPINSTELSQGETASSDQDYISLEEFDDDDDEEEEEEASTEANTNTMWEPLIEFGKLMRSADNAGQDEGHVSQSHDDVNIPDSSSNITSRFVNSSMFQANTKNTPKFSELIEPQQNNIHNDDNQSNVQWAHPLQKETTFFKNDSPSKIQTSTPQQPPQQPLQQPIQQPIQPAQPVQPPVNPPYVPAPLSEIPERDQIQNLNLDSQNNSELRKILKLSMHPFSSPVQNYSAESTFNNRAKSMSLEDLLGF